jgi:beta-xylosidase
VTLPAQQLIGFARLDLEPGALKTVAFTVPMSLLAYTGLSGDLVMEPGPVDVSAGSSSNDIRSRATFTVIGQKRSIRGEDRTFLSVATVAAWGEGLPLGRSGSCGSCARSPAALYAA